MATNNPLNEVLDISIPINDFLHIFLIYIHPHSRIEQTIFIKVCRHKYAVIIGDFSVNTYKKRQVENFCNKSSFQQLLTPPRS